MPLTSGSPFFGPLIENMRGRVGEMESSVAAEDKLRAEEVAKRDALVQAAQLGLRQLVEAQPNLPMMPVPEARSPLMTLAPLFSSGIASVLTGRPEMAQSTQNFLEGEIGQRRQAQATNVALSREDALRRHGQLLDLAKLDLDRKVQNAMDLGKINDAIKFSSERLNLEKLKDQLNQLEAKGAELEAEGAIREKVARIGANADIERAKIAASTDRMIAAARLGQGQLLDMKDHAAYTARLRDDYINAAKNKKEAQGRAALKTGLAFVRRSGQSLKEWQDALLSERVKSKEKLFDIKKPEDLALLRAAADQLFSPEEIDAFKQAMTPPTPPPPPTPQAPGPAGAMPQPVSAESMAAIMSLAGRDTQAGPVPREMADALLRKALTPTQRRKLLKFIEDRGK